MKTQNGVSIRSLSKGYDGDCLDVRRLSVVHPKLDLVPLVFLCVEQPQVVEVLCYGRLSRDDDSTSRRYEDVLRIPGSTNPPKSTI